MASVGIGSSGNMVGAEDACALYCARGKRGKSAWLSGGSSQNGKIQLSFADVIVINTNIPERFFARHTGDKGIRAAHAQYRAWLRIAEAGRWRAPPEIALSHPKASILKSGRVVFNIKGNSYRLVANVDYLASVIEIRFFGTHSEYDRIDAETV